MGNKKIKVIITGTTGMVGEGVLHECLRHPMVEKVLIVNRKPLNLSHPKLNEIIHSNFYDLSEIEGQLIGYDACFYCLGVSSVGMKEDEFSKISYDLTIHVAETLVRQNPDLVFTYVSGVGTDSTEKGRTMWARVKGRTENRLLSMPFKAAYMFRPGYLHPTIGLHNSHKYYRYIGWIYKIVKPAFPTKINSLAELGQAMIHSVLFGYEKKILNPKEIYLLSLKE
ncbi:MAG: hypothetical protein K0R71_753 [Bacillales bacterium]|jgi:uncharacterized protein YbjT (DUF2867 family)|nr:hypothetical protein [Bacillales bacterium]